MPAQNLTSSDYEYSRSASRDARRHRPLSSFIDWADDAAARALVLACILNINGVLVMLLNIQQVVSMGILALSLYLIVRSGNFSWSIPFFLAMSIFIGYILFGYMYFDPKKSIVNPFNHFKVYFGSILIVWAIASYVIKKIRSGDVKYFLYFVRNTFLISAFAIWLSPILYQFYVNLPPSSGSRMGGLFGNPNEAGQIAMLATALVFALPYRRLLVQVTALIIAIGGAILTFSKTAIGIVIILIALQFLRTRHTLSKSGLLGIFFLILPIFVLLGILFTNNAEMVFNTIAEQPVLDLDNEQKRRIKAVGILIAGNFENQTATTGRGDLWMVGLREIQKNFPFGSGFGSFHHFKGAGHIELGVLQGVHNTFLMILGEAGLLPFMFLLLWLAAMFHSSLRNEFGLLIFLCLIAVIAGMMTGHTALKQRYLNIVFAVLVGLTHHRRHQSHQLAKAPP